MLACKWVCLRTFVIELAYVPSTNHRKKFLDKERCIKEQIYFELLYLVAFSSPVKFSMVVFPVRNFVQSLKLCYKKISTSRCELLEIGLFSLKIE